MPKTLVIAEKPSVGRDLAARCFNQSHGKTDFSSLTRNGRSTDRLRASS